MSPTRLRVLVQEGDDEVRRHLADRVEVVDSPPADVGLVALDGHIDAEAVKAVGAMRDLSGAPVVAVVDSGLGARPARALAANADGVVNRDGFASALVPTLHAVAVGQAVFPAPLHRALQRPPLSNREKQILAMVVLGCSNAEIAAKLVVTESTVKNHLSSAFTKLGVHSRSAATSLITDPNAGLGLGVLRLSVADDTADISET
jgi:DNA-binding NarL/FixJ family response regulator